MFYKLDYGNQNSLQIPFNNSRVASIDNLNASTQYNITIQTIFLQGKQFRGSDQSEVLVAFTGKFS